MTISIARPVSLRDSFPGRSDAGSAPSSGEALRSRGRSISVPPLCLLGENAVSLKPGEPLRVLIVEDSQDVAESLRECLVLLGYRVDVAYSGPYGLDAARRFLPDVVLCDIGLPGMDGYAVAQELRRDPPVAGMRLFAVSGYGGQEDRRQAFAAGFDRHLTKPVDPDELDVILSGLRRDAP